MTHPSGHLSRSLLFLLSLPVFSNLIYTPYPSFLAGTLSTGVHTEKALPQAPLTTLAALQLGVGFSLFPLLAFPSSELSAETALRFYPRAPATEGFFIEAGLSGALICNPVYAGESLQCADLATAARFAAGAGTSIPVNKKIITEIKCLFSCHLFTSILHYTGAKHYTNITFNIRLTHVISNKV